MNSPMDRKSRDLTNMIFHANSILSNKPKLQYKEDDSDSYSESFSSEDNKRGNRKVGFKKKVSFNKKSNSKYRKRGRNKSKTVLSNRRNTVMFKKESSLSNLRSKSTGKVSFSS